MYILRKYLEKWLSYLIINVILASIFFSNDFRVGDIRLLMSQKEDLFRTNKIAYTPPARLP